MRKKCVGCAKMRLLDFGTVRYFLPRVAPFGSQPEPVRQGQALRLLHFVSQPGQAYLNVLNLKVPTKRERLLLPLAQELLAF